jgi:pimeloyl-ACP methyl ester carboxylesterase
VSAGEKLAGTPEPMHLWEGVGGVRIAGDSWGDPDGTLVMLLHGGGQTRHAWKNTGKILGAAGYHAVAFDARGHGDSDWDADGLYSQDAMVGDLTLLL